jgi:hypothetical protein
MFFFRFILFFILVYLIITSIGRFIFGIRRSGSSSRRDEFTHEHQRHEGDVSIQVDAKSKKKISKDTGEYVNYEEVEDNSSGE